MFRFKVILLLSLILSVCPNNDSCAIVNLLLGDKETAVKNLKDFSETLKTAKPGEHFDFEVTGLTYTFFYGSTLGQKCFKIWAPNSVSSDYGRLFKATIDDIIKYFSNNGK